MQSLLGAGDSVYASPENLYVATERVDDQPVTRQPAPRTAIHRFSAPATGAVAYAASGEVEGRLLHQFMPGDSHLDLRHTTTLHDESVDLALLPVWIFAIRYDEQKPPIRILVNGQTGKVGGRIPTSWTRVLKIAAAVLGILSLSVLIALLVALFQ